MRWAEFAELSCLFFLQGMATGAWFVPLGPVLEAHGLAAIKPWAFATSAVAAFVSPLVFGAMADRHAAPSRVLGGLALATAATTTLTALALRAGVGAGWVLALIQLNALCLSPTWGITTSIVLGRLSDSQRQFGPLRALCTLGWMAGCWVVSGLGADRSTGACFVSVATWLLVAGFAWLLRAVPPPKSEEKLTLRQRLGLDALTLLRQRDHRVVFITAALFAIPLAAFYPYAPSHLSDLGLKHTSAWMTLGQVSEIIAMLGLASVLGRWRLKWTLAAGLAFGVVRYALCALDGTGWVLVGVSLHGFGFTLFFITAQIYLDQRVDPKWRARAQALFTLVLSGIGNLAGYLGTGWWHAVANRGRMNWPLFWGGLAVVAFVVLVFFLIAYRGRPSHSGEK